MRNKIPFVVVDHRGELGADVPSVGATNWLGGRTATEYLLSLGHQRIAIISGDSNLRCSRDRIAGYRAVLEDVGVPVVAVSLFAAYAISRILNGFTRVVFSLFLLGLAIPLQATIIPIYALIIDLHLYDTLFALILPSVAFGIPLSVLVLVTHIRDIPQELHESMLLDGASHFRILRSLVLPLSRPALVTVIIYETIQVWNSFLFPLVLTQSPSVRVLPLALWSYQGQFTTDVPAILAAVFLSAIPIILLYVSGRRQLLSGLMAGFSK
ncbi:MAG TPA: ABC transporter permease subunit [Ktedonobacteraceae bacterium]|nr:ABC transporter permease subunit [Ktedonobacteraceae bacterium]